MSSILRDELIRDLLDTEENVGIEFLSRWTFERQLDRIASSIQKYLNRSIPPNSSGQPLMGGCSIFYRFPDDSAPLYRLGGGSKDRRKMSRSSRSYDLRRPESGFTAFSIISNVILLLEPFKKSTKDFGDKSLVYHKTKDCENPAEATNSFYCRPLSDTPIDKIVREPGDVPKKTIGVDLPLGALRISSPREDVIESIHRLIDDALIQQLYEVVKVGTIRVSENRDRGALTIADFNADLLRYRNSEYYGLDRLAYHLQTIFDECEVSIFIADRPPQDPREPWVTLRLAATTALGRSDQHTKFRRTFNSEGEHYSCFFHPDYRPLKAAPAKAAKTELAYYFPDDPIHREENTTSSKFAGRGEFENSGSFLAMAIPGESPESLPYGVIRIVSEKNGYFDTGHKRLFAAVCRGLAFWAQLFPRSPRLNLQWLPSADINEAARHLKGNTDQELIGAEILQLLSCIFSQDTGITISRIDTNSTNHIMFDVQDQRGAALQVYCWRKDLSEFPKFSSPGIRETRHLWGKIVRWPQQQLESYHSRLLYDVKVPNDLEQTGLQFIGGFADFANSVLPNSNVIVKIRPNSAGWGLSLEGQRGRLSEFKDWFKAYLAHFAGDESVHSLIDAAIDASGRTTDFQAVQEELSRISTQLQDRNRDVVEILDLIRPSGTSVVNLNIGAVPHESLDASAIERIISALENTRALVQKEDQAVQLDDLAKTVQQIKDELRESRDVSPTLLQRAHQQIEQFGHVVNDVTNVFSATSKGLEQFRLLRDQILSFLPVL